MRRLKLTYFKTIINLRTRVIKRLLCRFCLHSWQIHLPPEANWQKSDGKLHWRTPVRPVMIWPTITSQAALGPIGSGEMIAGSLGGRMWTGWCWIMGNVNWSTGSVDADLECCCDAGLTASDLCAWTGCCDTVTGTDTWIIWLLWYCICCCEVLLKFAFSLLHLKR